MQQSGKEQLATLPEQQLLSCSVAESVGMIAASLQGNELSADPASVSEQLRRQPRKTLR
ncbi:hypothetical protein [Paenibacillus xerothermodurans]|uniref:hypothetical protein n=1 Tax=Paenibacillus xerothermodurans TaxID=1977292 RepID=UPI001401DDA6|nr:hypothetical protein [Paenibacillus xerothermodurans]